MLAVLTSCSPAQPSRPGPGSADMKQIQGTWKTVSLEANGKRGPAEIVAVLKLAFNDDTLTFTPGEPGFTRYKFKLDPTAKPPTFTMVHAEGPDTGKSESGTYLLEGDRLELCFWAAHRVSIGTTGRAETPTAKYQLVRTK